MQSFDSEIDENIGILLGKEKHGKQRRWRQKKSTSFKKINAFIDSTFYHLIMLAATVYALFAVDLNMAAGSKDNDEIVDIGTLFVLFLFVVEIILSLLTNDNQR